MTRTEIANKELPKKIRVIKNKLITATWEWGDATPIRTIYGYCVTPDRLEMFVKKIYCEKLEVGERYDFEIAPSDAEEAGGAVSLVYLPSKKSRRSDSLYLLWRGSELRSLHGNKADLRRRRERILRRRL